MKGLSNKRKPDSDKPEIWVSGGQRPPFEFRAFGRASLFLAREGAAPLLGWMATSLRRAAVNLAAGAGRISSARLGRAARFVPSHLRVAAWLQNVAATLAHASANADPDVERGNALVARIEPPLWLDMPKSEAPPPTSPAPSATLEPVVLPEPMRPEDDPLRGIRDDLERPASSADESLSDASPPAAPGPLTTAAIQVIGYGLGWAISLAALPYGLCLALWKHARGEDLRKVGTPD